MMHQSVATLQSPQFINLQPNDINPLMTQCEIKVFYLGANRNRSFITEEVALEMAKTLRGAPIVGQYKSDIEDFGGHGETIIFDDEGIKFKCETVPYGFVSPDADVWFQTFEEFDNLGEKVERKYLMTTGYLWTGQFEECKAAVTGEGKAQSMEIDEKSLQGYWTNEIQSDVEFFIINDAVFSKLCILGDDVEPCFEGASITKSPTNNFSIDEDFSHTLYSMLQDLRNLTKKEGGQTMALDTEKKKKEEEEKKAKANEEKEAPVQPEKKEESAPTQPEAKPAEEEEDKKKPSTSHEKKDNEEEKKEAEPSKEEEKEAPSKEEDKPAEEKNEPDTSKNPFAPKEDEEEKKTKHACKDDEEKKKYSAEEFEALQNKYSEALSKIEELSAFKAEVENAKKDELISSFYMLSDEDKEDVVSNKTSYSYDEIKAKLAIICVDKKVSFTKEEESSKVEETPIMTYDVSSSESNSAPAWIAAARRAKKDNN